MFSKLRLILLPTVTFLLFSGCGWVHDQPKAQASFQTLNLTCLQVMPTQLQILFAGGYTTSAADQEQVAQIWSCLNHSLEVFAKNTRGANPDYYSSKELQLFANRYFPADNQLSPDFANAIFRLKKAVLGGNDTTITQPELTRLEEKLKTFGVMIAPLSSQIGVLLTPNESTLPQKITAAHALNAFVLKFADLLADSKNPLPWTDLTAFVTELEKYTTKTPTSALTAVREQLPIFQYLKLLIIGGDENRIEREKWQPIFQSISKVYNAIYLAENFSQMFESLTIDVQSTDAERRSAVKKISGLLVFMKNDPNYSSKNTVETLSDQWAKALLANAFLFPNSQGGLAVKAILDSPSIRKISGYLADQLNGISIDSLSSEKIKALADNAAALIAEAGKLNAPGANQTSTLSLSSYRNYVSQLRPLFHDPAQADIFLTLLDTLKTARPLLVGTDLDTLTPTDFSVIIGKAADIYLAWKKDNPLSFLQSLGQTLDALQRPPVPPRLDNDRVYATLQSAAKLLLLLKVDPKVDWPKVAAYLKPNAPVQISDLVNELRLDPNAVSAETVGDLKLLLIGGNATTLDPGDFPKLVNVASVFTQNLLPALRVLPKNFKLDLNAATLEVVQAFLSSLAIIRSDGIPYLDIRNTALSLSKKSGYNVSAATLDKVLIGLDFRVFQHQRSAKPTVLSGRMLPAYFKQIADVFDSLKKDLTEVESVYAGLDVDHTPIEKSELLAKVKSPVTLDLIQKTHPQLDGVHHWLYFPNAGQTLTAYYSYDLTYKLTLNHLLNWVLPAYRIEPDTEASPYPRLSMVDLTDLLYDLDDAITEFQLSLGTGTPKEVATKRMQTINLFPTTGNGDLYADTMETTEFLTMADGGDVIFERARKDIVQYCFPNVPDYQTITKIPMKCLNEFFFNPTYFTALYEPVIPQFAELYQSLSQRDRDDFRRAALNATAAGLADKDSIELSDLETLVPLPYYLENVFERLDQNKDGLIQLNEALDVGFPIFCWQIKAFSGLGGSCYPGQNPGLIQAVYGYLLFNGIPPNPGIFNSIGFLYWAKIKWPHYRRYPESLKPLNRKDMLMIIANLSTPDASVLKSPAASGAFFEALLGGGQLESR